MDRDNLVDLECEAETLMALAARLSRFGPAGGEPDWLVSGVWLCCGDSHYLATASTKILPNGFVARPLNVAPIAAVISQIETQLPDISARLIGRNGDFELPGTAETPSPPPNLSPWTERRYSTQVLIRVSRRGPEVDRVACALLFAAGADLLLVGTDPSSLAMVLTDEPAVIDLYRSACETMCVGDYLARA